MTETPQTLRVMEGVVQEWDSNTGENVVTIAGGTVANLKSLTGESASLAVGDVVLVMSTGDRFYVFGKATTPGDPGTVPTWTADITALTGQVDTIQTVTIPAVQDNVVIVQGQVTELDTVTVPAVQAAAEAAQSAADTAQAAVDPLVPLTDLAAVTNGTTITGATIATDDVPPRIALNDPDYPNELIMESGQTNETAPGRMFTQVTGVSLKASSVLRSPALDGGSTAALGLTADAASLGGKTLAQIDGHDIVLNTFAATVWRPARTVYKTADTTINNNAGLATDPELQFAGIAAGTYTVEALILYSSSIVANWKGFMTGTGSLSDRLLMVQRDLVGGGSTYGVAEGAVTFNAAGAGVGAKRALRVVGTFKATADGQAYNLQWAQNTAEATNTVVHKGSFYRIQRIA